MLAEAIQLAKARGHYGVAVVHQGGTATPYVAMCVGPAGRVCDPRNHDPHPTAEAALADLARTLREEQGRAAAGGGI